jgi:peroxiredoxin
MADTSGSVKKIAFLAVLIVLIASFIGGYLVMDRNQCSKESTGTKVITSGDRAPEFRLQKLDGGYVSLADLHGKVVMVHFWATWCPPCVEELPLLDRLRQSPLGKDLEMLAVNEDGDGTAALVSFVKQNKVSLPVLLDAGSEVARTYGTFKLPETYIVDRQGVVRAKAIGPWDWNDPANMQTLRNIIEAR